MGSESTLAGLRTGLPARQLAKDITLYQSSASKRITLQLQNQVDLTLYSAFRRQKHVWGCTS